MPPWGTSRTAWDVQLTPCEVRSQQRAAFLLGHSEVFQAGRLCPVTPEPKTLTVPGVEQSLKTYCRPGMRRGGKCHPRMLFEAWPGEGWLIPQACMDSCPCLPGLPALVAGSGWPRTLRGQVFAGVSQEVWLKPSREGSRARFCCAVTLPKPCRWHIRGENRPEHGFQKRVLL